MPKDLPGLYWDAERNRYFPVSSRPPCQAAVVAEHAPRQNASKKRKFEKRAAKDKSDGGGGATVISHVKRRQNLHPWSLAQSAIMQPSWNWVNRERVARGILSSHIGATTQFNYNHAPTRKITTFCTYRGHDPQTNSPRRWYLLGDGQGWLFRCKALHLDNQTHEPSPLDSDMDLDADWLSWSAELNLQPKGSVSSISMWGSRWVATGAGTSARFASSDIKSLDRMFIVTLPGARDLWASNLRERAVAFGASYRAIYIPDIDHSTSPEQLNTNSDVFTVVQDQNLIFTGSRNGSIHRFDKRVGFKRRGDLLLDARFSDDRSSVLSLSLLGGASDDPSLYSTPTARTLDFGLFVSQMNGQLQTFDLRFVSSMGSSRSTPPVVRYEGHVNTHTRELGLAIDHQTDFVYAAGQDCRIRGWSLSSGDPIVPSSPSPPSSSSSSTTSPLFSSSTTTPLASSHQTSDVTMHRYGSSPAWMHANPFLAQFSDPIPVLRVSADDADPTYRQSSSSSSSPLSPGDDDEGERVKHSGTREMTSLWAASGEDLWRWNLGQRNDRSIVSSFT